MVTGNAGIITKPILRETKVTLYKLHPSDFGRVMIMPNLPNGLHEADLWRRKGYKNRPEDLMPGAKLERDPEGGLFLVPHGYSLNPVVEKTEFEKKLIDVTIYHVIKNNTSTQVEGDVSELKCPECGRVCATEFGLKVHMRAHKK